MMALGLAACVSGEQDNQKEPTPTVEPAPRDTSYFTFNGVPYAGEDQWPQPERVGTFTVVNSGLVFVDPETSQIIWEDWEHNTRIIGERPWRNPAAPDRERDYGVYGEHRDIVGHPDHDVVTWVESVAGRRGDIVVVEASTGDVLARAPIDAPPEFSVLIASVDGTSVYFATLGAQAPPARLVPSESIWVWRWATGGSPQTSQRGDSLVVDVSGDIWAVERQFSETGGLFFEDASGRVLTEVAGTFDVKTYFGGGLSPDGRFWYGPTHGQVVETATGRRVDIEEGFDIRYGWTGASELTLIGPGLRVCDVVVGECGERLSIPGRGTCSDSACIFGLPVN
ncbi:MAG: hypothetical protein JWQ59_1562 [Cryobacterium sp.]|nr:hypothetical protein [Cryobacterium sp.]